MEFQRSFDIAMLQAGDVLCVRMPTTLKGKEPLLAWYAQALRLPAYFGHNWDALDECLRDLGWIEERIIVISHDCLPALTSEDSQTYLQLLSDTEAYWRGESGHEFFAVFNYELKNEIEGVLRQ